MGLPRWNWIPEEDADQGREREILWLLVSSCTQVLPEILIVQNQLEASCHQGLGNVVSGGQSFCCTRQTSGWSWQPTGRRPAWEHQQDCKPTTVWDIKGGVSISYGWGANTGIRDLASQTRARQKARSGSWGKARLWCGQSHVPVAHPYRAFCCPQSWATGVPGLAGRIDGKQTRRKGYSREHGYKWQHGDEALKGYTPIHARDHCPEGPG